MKNRFLAAELRTLELSRVDCMEFQIIKSVSKGSAGSDHQERTLSRVLRHYCQKREPA